MSFVKTCTPIVDQTDETTSFELQRKELLYALRAAEKALDAISQEMTVGERYTNAGQYLIDALPVVRDAISKYNR